MPLVSGINDSDELIEKTISLFIANGINRVSLLPYHELGIAKYVDLGVKRQTFDTPSLERLEEIRKYFSASGINADISGNSDR